MSFIPINTNQSTAYFSWLHSVQFWACVVTDYSMTSVLNEPGTSLGVVPLWSLGSLSEMVGDSGFLKLLSLTYLCGLVIALKAQVMDGKGNREVC